MSTPRKPRLGLAVVLVLFAVMALPTGASASEGAPRWHINFRSFPTVLIPGSVPARPGTEAVPQYSAVITNVGGGEASGKTTAAVTLPPGVTLAAGLEGVIKSEGEGECNSVSATEVVCEIEEDVPSGFGIAVAIPLEISPSAPSLATSRLEGCGGGCRASRRDPEQRGWCSAAPLRFPRRLTWLIRGRLGRRRPRCEPGRLASILRAA